MSIPDQIDTYIASQPEPKRKEMDGLHQLILKIKPSCKLWFLDGKDSANKVVSNPNIGYGVSSRTYADGQTKEFYRIGLSANTTGISVYFMGLANKDYLAKTYGKTIGKANVTGYCIKFKSVNDIDLQTLETAIRDGLNSK